MYYDMYLGTLNYFWFQGIVRRLKNYGVTSMPQVSIQLALEEARRILAEIKQRSYGSESDIR